MDQKLKRIILCIYSIAAIEALSLLYSLYWKIQLLKIPQNELGIPISEFDLIGMSTVVGVLLIVATFKVASGLKEKRDWAWAGSIAVCLVSSPGFALPISIYGLILLWDLEMRTHFLKELEAKVKL